jgi:hypothetical protein
MQLVKQNGSGSGVASLAATSSRTGMGELEANTVTVNVNVRQTSVCVCSGESHTACDNDSGKEGEAHVISVSLGWEGVRGCDLVFEPTLRFQLVLIAFVGSKRMMSRRQVILPITKNLIYYSMS